jgi:hypothetical protein
MGKERPQTSLENQRPFLVQFGLWLRETRNILKKTVSENGRLTGPLILAPRQSNALRTGPAKGRN